MMAISDDQGLVRHLILNEFQTRSVCDGPDAMGDAVFVLNLNVGPALDKFFQLPVDALMRVFIEHEDLLEMSSRMPQQLEPIFFGTGKRAFMRENNLSIVVFELRGPDESSSD